LHHYRAISPAWGSSSSEGRSARDVEARYVIDAVRVVAVHETVAVIILTVITELFGNGKGGSVARLRAEIGRETVGIFAVDELVIVVVDSVVADLERLERYAIH
jgi:hypothetical protein